MSNSHLFLTAGFPKAPLNNGVGRYIGQLQRVVIKFCKSHGSSKGVREFVESNLIDFSRANPGVAVYVKPRRHRSPSITAEFCNGESGYIDVKNMSRDEVFKWLNHFTTQSGKKVMRYRKLWHTESPSIQGVWSPHTLRDPELNIAKFPLENHAGPIIHQPTATELLIEMFKKQQLEGSGESDDGKTKE
uniref:Large ribosomal subunit protein mL43 n=1 Tax=Lygus hesperus TaxID=30085 RepID=A0A0A9XV19_LYGHE